MHAIIVDIDGTLTLGGNDANEPVIAKVRAVAADADIIIVSARPASRLNETRKWLDAQQVPHARLYLNDFADQSGPNVAEAFKTYKFDELATEFGEDLEYVVDNDPDMREIARKRGLTALSPEEFVALDAQDGEDLQTHPTTLHRASTTCQYKALDDAAKVGRFSGYGAVFGNVDAYKERLLPGAFTATLADARASGRMPAMLWQHDPTQPIGVWRAMHEDAHGLYVEGELADTQLGREAYSLLKLGALSGLSIGFSVKSDRFDQRDQVRELESVHLWEVSPVTFPANTAARVAQVKTGSSMTIREFERFLREAGSFSAQHAKAIAARGYRALRDEAKAPGTVDTAWLQDMARRLSV